MHIFNGKVLVILVTIFYDVWCVTPCTGGGGNSLNYGLTSTNLEDVTGEDSDQGVAILLANTDFDFECCGYLEQWNFFAKGGSNGDQFDAQVWRPITGGDSYELVGYNTLTSNDMGNNEEQHSISNGQRIRVNNGDFIGMHSTSYLRVTLKGSNPSRQRKKLTGITSQMSSPYDWSSAVEDNKEYAIVAVVTKSVTPNFVGLINEITVWNDEVMLGDIVKSVSCCITDGDKEDIGNLNVTLDSANNNGELYFNIPTNSYNITVISVPPTGSYTLTLRVEDPCTKSSTGNIKITVQNRPPVINNLPDSVSISEDTEAALLFTINATDTVTDPVSCSMQGGDSTKFEVKIISGTTYGVYSKSTAAFDYDTESTYTVTVRCDDGDDTVDEDLTVNLLRNEPPVINSLPDITSIHEDINTRTLLHTINVTDSEGDTLNCTLQTHTGLFEVVDDLANSEYGIYLSGGTTLDYDTTSSYTVTVTCMDKRRGDTESLTVNLIRNTPPDITSLANTTSISEDLVTRTLLHTIELTDVDVADVHTCNLTNYPDLLFEVTEITPSSGVYGVFLSGGTFLNYDITPSYTISVTCKDHRRPGTPEDLTVFLIRNEPPTVTNLPKSLEFSEGTSTETFLYTVSVTDPTNDTVTCVLSNTVTSHFLLQPSADQYENGIYTRNNVVFSYDTQKTYKLEVTCSDARRSDTETLYVYLIRNMPPKFTNLQAKTTASAAAATGTVVFTVNAEDSENDPLQYTISSPGSYPFAINLNTGEISLSRSIKNEDITGYDLPVYVTDGQNTVGPSILTIMIVDINFPPVLTNLPLTISVLEGASIGDTIFRTSVEDKDLIDPLTFSVIYNPPEGAVYFYVNKTDGSLSSISTIDYETISSHTFTFGITVSDSQMTDSANLTVNIVNINEPPVFTKSNYAFTAAEATAGTVLQDPYFQCIDQDGDTLKYTFDCGSDTGRFDMDSTSGLLSYSIDYDLDIAGTSSVVQCKVYASDSEYSAIANLNITVLDDNDNSPVFQHDAYTFFVSKGISIGTPIGQVIASDADIGNYGQLLYYIEQETFESSIFGVSEDGTISTKELLTSYAEGSVHNFTVYAIDTGGRIDSTLVAIVIPSTTYTSLTADNPELYFTFFSYAPNMAWFVPALMFAAIASGFVIHALYNTTCDFKCPKRRQRKNIQRRRRRN